MLHDYVGQKAEKRKASRIGCSGQAKDKQNAKKKTADSKEIPTSIGDMSPGMQNNKTEHADKVSPATNMDPVYMTTDCSWNTDTGASSHMTPHWHWK